MTLLGSLSPEGSSKSFDASADGYARGEAVSAIYIKRLDEAIRDGNPVRAVIRSSATNVDGKTNGISMPNGHAHEALIRQAYDAIGLDMSGTAMVEAHGKAFLELACEISGDYANITMFSRHWNKSRRSHRSKSDREMLWRGGCLPGSRMSKIF